MGSLPPDESAPPQNAPDDRLDSWKEIAGYLKRDVTTVQRWEKREGMPVHRHRHDKLGSVYAYRRELNRWVEHRNQIGVPTEVLDASGAPAPEPYRARHVWIGAIAAIAIASLSSFWALRERDDSWRNPLADAEFQRLTDFNGVERAAAISNDGRFVAFLSDRDGATDVWVTQLGTGQFYNLTHGQVAELINPSIRVLNFSPDSSHVTFWARAASETTTGEISVWAVPTLGGPRTPYLEGVAEFGWSHDATQLTYHTPGPGDPMFVRRSGQRGDDRPIHSAAAGLHAHFPLWSPDRRFIYFVEGMVPDAMDIWRMRPDGSALEQITHMRSRVTYPVMLDATTLLYLATDTEGAGPWLYSIDIERRLPYRVGSGIDRYTSLAASADGARLVMTLSNPKSTLWRLPIGDRPADASAATPVTLSTSGGSAPRFGSGYLLYVTSKEEGDRLWKLTDGEPTALWGAPQARIIGGPEIDAASGRIVFAVEQHGGTRVVLMHADGTNVRSVASTQPLMGPLAWGPNGSITVAARVDGNPRLFALSLDGSTSPLVRDYSTDPVWAPDGRFVVFSGPDIGATFSVNAASTSGPHPLPPLTLSRGGRRVRFLKDSNALVVMRGDLQHKNLYAIDLQTGGERQLTDLPPGFDVRDFDVAADGREIILERVQEESDLVLVNVPR